MVRHSYLEKFKLGGEIKTFIFDATADISEMYPTGAEWLNVLDCSDFNVPLDFLKVHIVDVNTSRNALINKESKDKTLKAIKDYIDNMDYLGNLDRMSDYYSSEGMIDDWKETRMKIGAATREKNRMREAWRKFYGKDMRSLA